MKKKLVLMLCIVLLFSCKKEEAPVEPIVQKTPIIVHYDILAKSAILLNNADPTTVLNGYIDTYGIQFHYQSDGNKYFAIVFPQMAAGDICIQNPNTTTHTIVDVVKYKLVFDEYQFYFKFGKGEETFSFSPATIKFGDTTSQLTITNKTTLRKVRVSMDSIFKQEFFCLYADY